MVYRHGESLMLRAARESLDGLDEKKGWDKVTALCKGKKGREILKHDRNAMKSPTFHEPRNNN